MSAAAGITAEAEARQEASIASRAVATQVVVCLGPWYEDASAESLQPLLMMLRNALGELASTSLVAYPASDPQATSWEHEGMLLQPYLPTAKLQAISIQTASTYLSLYEVMRAHSSGCGLLLGAEAHTLAPAAAKGLIQAVLGRGADLAMARYQTGENEALINASTLHPLSRAVFGAKVQFPLALDHAMSLRMAERMAAAAQRFTANSQMEALVWPASEAAFASFTVAEVDAGRRDLPHPAGSDLSSILNTTAASLFSDIEAKAAYWQRSRQATQLISVSAVDWVPAPAESVPTNEVNELIESFRIAYGNLHEIWSLVLPPQTLLGLKRLSRSPAESFALPHALWVRIVYDYVLAHRLRTINRGHLMGAFTPLYLAWVASHLSDVQKGTSADPLEALARAFEADKPYLVSRWRWPDRFNP